MPLIERWQHGISSTDFINVNSDVDVTEINSSSSVVVGDLNGEGWVVLVAGDGELSDGVGWFRWMEAEPEEEDEEAGEDKDLKKP